MKRVLCAIMAAIFLLGLTGCGREIPFVLPFEVSDVEKVVSYYDDGVSPTVQKKTTEDPESIGYLYDFFSQLKLKDEPIPSYDPASIVYYVFVLADGSSYELIYVGLAVKTGRLIAPKEVFDYQTSADIFGYWTGMSGEVEQIPRG